MSKLTLPPNQPPINHLNAELNPIRHLLALVGARHIVHVSRIRVKRVPAPPPPPCRHKATVSEVDH